MPTIIPQVIERAQQGAMVGYDIYSRLLKDRIIFVGGYEGAVTAIMRTRATYGRSKTRRHGAGSRVTAALDLKALQSIPTAHTSQWRISRPARPKTGSALS